MKVRSVAVGFAFAGIGALFVASACSFRLGEVKPQDAGDDDANPSPVVKAFPSAEGYGASTVGGRAGKVVFVDNLDDSGLGSLRQALELLTGPRTVIFRVAGTIALKKPIRISTGGSYVTVAGQTAPGDGVQLKNYGIVVDENAHEVVLRFLRIRPGTDGMKDGGSGNTSGLRISGSSGGHVSNVIVDHSSFEWTPSDNIEAHGWVTDLTVQWTLLGESLLPTGGGLSVQYDSRATVSVHHNLFAHNPSRNPSFQDGDTLDFRNNIAFNWLCNNGASFGGSCPASFVKVNFVNNQYLEGADSTCLQLVFLEGRDGTRIYPSGNWGPHCPIGCGDEWEFRFDEITHPQCPDVKVYEAGLADAAAFRSATAFDTPAVTTHRAEELMDIVLPRVGADRPSRDAVDARIVADVIARTGKDVGDGGVYPALNAGPPPVDTDADGMPDAWENAHGLQAGDPSDGSAFARNGYTNLENYLNELAGDAIP